MVLGEKLKYKKIIEILKETLNKNEFKKNRIEIYIFWVLRRLKIEVIKNEVSKKCVLCIPNSTITSFL